MFERISSALRGTLVLPAAVIVVSIVVLAQVFA